MPLKEIVIPWEIEFHLDRGVGVSALASLSRGRVFNPRKHHGFVVRKGIQSAKCCTCSIQAPFLPKAPSEPL